MCTGDYEQHINTMFGLENVEDFSNKKIDEVLDNLIKCIPNNGKLYKYRKIDNKEEIDNVYKGLTKGYLWSSRVDEFYDETDCVINYNPVSEAKGIMELLLNNPQLFLNVIMQALSDTIREKDITMDETVIEEILSCVDRKNMLIDDKKAVDVFVRRGYSRESSIDSIASMSESIKKCLDDAEPQAKEIAENFVNFNTKYQKMAFVCSLCEDYRVKSMWDNYANGNGICIEYDYNKLRGLSYKTKALFISTYRVEYNDNPIECSFVPCIVSSFGGDEVSSLAEEMYRKALISTITKSTDYDKEKEWRLYHCNLVDGDEKGAPLYANIVSRIIFDEKSLNTDNGIRLLRLCKVRHWDIVVRCINITRTKHKYIPYEEYVKRGEKDV